MRGNDLLEILRNGVPGETHCMELCSQVLRKKTTDFIMRDLHFDADGLVAIYDCSLGDGCEYVVKIVPRNK